MSIPYHTIKCKSLGDNGTAAECDCGAEGMLDSTSDQRTENNVMRHEYRTLADNEKAEMQEIKDHGLTFHTYLENMGSSRELSLAKTKIEEAVMWAVKHVTK